MASTVSLDFEAVKAHFVSIEDAVMQIGKCFATCNAALEQAQGKSSQQVWMDQLQAMQAEAQKQASQNQELTNEQITALAKFQEQLEDMSSGLGNLDI